MQKYCVLILKRYICKVNKAQQLKKRSMKNLITYFTPRNTEEHNSLFGIFAGLFILSIVFYFYSL